jgi:hypothetical protein
MVRDAEFNINAEVNALEDMHQEEYTKNKSTLVSASNSNGVTNESTWDEVLTYKNGVIIGIGLQLCGAFTGINTVIFYSATIFGLAGVNEAILAAAAVGGECEIVQL